jgi:hypothetical protein
VILTRAACPAEEDSQTDRWLDVVHQAVVFTAVDVAGEDDLDRPPGKTIDQQLRR